MFGLQDGNNYYASCERVFDPRLRGKPVVVLSNNDGCAIARSAEATALGAKMGQPIHEVPDQVCRQLSIRAANFGLYGDLSQRIVGILRDLMPSVEIYSIDENFFCFPEPGDRIKVAHQEGNPHQQVSQRICDNRCILQSSPTVGKECSDV